MILGLVEPTLDLEFAIGIHCRTKNDLLKEIQTDQPAATKGRQHAAGLEQAHCQQVDIFVAAQRAVQVGVGLGKFRWIENDQIKGLNPVIAPIAQYLEDITGNAFTLAVGFKAIGAQIRFPQR